MKLKAGMWIAQGPQTNILLLLHGEAPMLKVGGAIDLAAFKSTGKAKQLDESSVEVQDILMYPDKYTFEPPCVTSSIDSEGFSSKFETVADLKDKDEMISAGIEYVKTGMFLSTAERKSKTCLYLFRKFGITYGQACNLYALIVKKCNRPEL